MARTIPKLQQTINKKTGESNYSLNIPREIIHYMKWQKGDDILPIISPNFLKKDSDKYELTLINVRLDHSWKLDKNPGLKAIYLKNLEMHKLLYQIKNMNSTTKKNIHHQYIENTIKGRYIEYLTAVNSRRLKPFQCEICRKRCKNAEERNEHYKEIHKKEYKYPETIMTRGGKEQNMENINKMMLLELESKKKHLLQELASVEDQIAEYKK